MTTTIEQARRVLDIEAKAILNLKDRIGDQFEQAIRLLLSCKGKVVVTGMGKSGQICRKIAATFASTGTPAFFFYILLRGFTVIWEWLPKGMLS